MQNEFELFLKNYPEPVQLIAKQLRKIIQFELPGVKEMVDAPSKIIAYGASAKYVDLVCAIVPYPKYVNLVFSRGASMPDPDGVLKGTGKKARHIRVNVFMQQLEKQIRKYLQIAGQTGKKATTPPLRPSSFECIDRGHG